MRDWAADQITLVMIRHGATASNREHRYLGRRDEPLSKEGQEELLRYRKRCLYPQVEYLFTGPLQRCVQTAQILYPQTEPVRIAEWTEIDFGDFEGKNYKELQGDTRYQEWIDSGGTRPFPGGESREDFLVRCRKGFEEMCRYVKARTGERGFRTVGMTVHGGTIMALLSYYGGGEYFDYQVGNGQGYLCVCSGLDTGIRFTRLKKLE